MPKRIKPDYSKGLIRKLLDGYAELEDGRNPLERNDNGTEFTSPKVMKASLSNRSRNIPQVLKADLDRAIQALTPRHKLVVLGCNIDCRSPYDMAYWMSGTVSDVLHWEDQAVGSMSQFLGGKQDEITSDMGNTIQ